MKRMDDTEGCEMLREVGCTVQEIEKLRLLRDAYVMQERQKQVISPVLPVPHAQVKHDTWFEKVVRKLLSMCRFSADCETSFWMHDHFLY